MRVLHHLNSAVIAWSVYAFTRALDVMTTSLLLEINGRDLDLEFHMVPRLFMWYYGVHQGNILHEISVLAAAILLYILIRIAHRNFSIFRLTKPAIVPYTIAFASAGAAINNLLIAFR